MKRLVLLLTLALFLLLPTSVAAAECQFVLGFKTLRDLIGHEIVGECLENEHHGANGDGLQQTTGGLLVWRKADNWTAFTDGYRTWINGPNGLVQRLNTERFAWEADYAPGGGIATPTPTPTPRATATPIPQPEPTPTAVPTTKLERRTAFIKFQISNLRWVRNGLTNHLEEFAFDLLQKWIAQSPELAWDLSQTAWLRSSWLDLYESHRVDSHWLLRRIDAMADRDESVARRLIHMPFMQDISFGAEITWRVLIDILDSDREGFYRLLAHPKLARGIRSDQAAEIPLVYLESIDPQAAAAIRNMAWIREIPSDADVLRRLAQTSPSVFWAWMAQCGDDDFQCTYLLYILHLAEIDEASTVQLIRMPFMSTRNDGSDGVLMQLARDLAVSDPAGLKRVLAHPKLARGITDDDVATFALLALGREHPEAAAAIEALRWVRDGVGRPSTASQSGRRRNSIALEEVAVLNLVEIARESQDVVLNLVRKPWLRNGVTGDEVQVLYRLPELIQFDAASALQIVKMPFLETSVSTGDYVILYTLTEMMRYSPNPNKPEVLREALAEPLLRGGIKDGYRNRVEFLAIGRRSPEIAAAIYSLPWIQDGIEGTEWKAMTVLSEASRSAPRFIPILVSYPWVQDGLTRSERDRVGKLMRLYW